MDNQNNAIDKVNEKLPVPQLAVLGLQHVLAMYAGAVTVPLIIGAAAGLEGAYLAMLVAADLLTCGIATLIQSVGMGKHIGIKLPAILGCTFAAVGPLSLVAKDSGLPTAFGAIIVGGAVVILIAPLYGKLLRFFPSVVTGSVVTIIGLSLIQVGIRNAGGGYSDSFGSPTNLALAGFTVLVIILCNKFFKGFMQAISVLIGIILGTILGIILHVVNFSVVADANWVGIVKPFALGVPVFEPSAIIVMIVVMLIVMIESTGTFLGIAQVCGKTLTDKDIVRGFRAEGIATILGGIMNAFPYTTFNQNLGLLSLSKVTSRFVVVASGIILVLLGLIPKFAALATIIPPSVIGGATTIMFAMVAVAGFKMLAKVDFSKNSNMIVVACSIGLGLGVAVLPDIFGQFPGYLKSIFSSGIVTGAFVAVLLNAFLNHGETESEFASSQEEGESGMVI